MHYTRRKIQGGVGALREPDDTNILKPNPMANLETSISMAMWQLHSISHTYFTATLFWFLFSLYSSVFLSGQRLFAFSLGIIISWIKLTHLLQYLIHKITELGPSLIFSVQVKSQVSFSDFESSHKSKD